MSNHPSDSPINLGDFNPAEISWNNIGAGPDETLNPY